MHLAFGNADGYAEIDTDTDNYTFDEIDTMLGRLAGIVIRTRATYDQLGFSSVDADDK